MIEGRMKSVETVHIGTHSLHDKRIIPICSVFFLLTQRKQSYW